MKKSDSLEDRLSRWDPTPESQLPRELRAFMVCFHSGEFYEAHDILEHLWLRCFDSNRPFFQGLIQIAGAFVHFQKNLQFPNHPTHSKRVAPGRRLLELAQRRLSPFTATQLHLGVDVPQTLRLCSLWSAQALQNNPLQILPLPTLPFLATPTESRKPLLLLTEPVPGS